MTGIQLTICHRSLLILCKIWLVTIVPRPFPAPARSPSIHHQSVNASASNWWSTAEIRVSLLLRYLIQLNGNRRVNCYGEWHVIQGNNYYYSSSPSCSLREIKMHHKTSSVCHSFLFPFLFCKIRNAVLKGVYDLQLNLLLGFFLCNFAEDEGDEDATGSKLKKNPRSCFCSNSKRLCLTTAAFPSSTIFLRCFLVRVSVNFSTATGSVSSACKVSITNWCNRENLAVVSNIWSTSGLRSSKGITFLYISSQIAATRRICRLE